MNEATTTLTRADLQREGDRVGDDVADAGVDEFHEGP